MGLHDLSQALTKNGVARGTHRKEYRYLQHVRYSKGGPLRRMQDVAMNYPSTSQHAHPIPKGCSKAAPHPDQPRRHPWQQEGHRGILTG